jgi:hypothetical protein
LPIIKIEQKLKIAPLTKIQNSEKWWETVFDKLDFFENDKEKGGANFSANVDRGRETF